MKDLAFLIEMLGEEVTLKLVETYGGTRRYVPQKLLEQHEMREALGDDGFEALQKCFGGFDLPIPQAREWRFHIYNRSGLSARIMARKLGLTERRVRQMMAGDVRSAHQIKNRQLSLF